MSPVFSTRRSRRDPVHDLVIDRRAKHAGIIVIPLECRLGAQLPDLAVSHPLQIHRAIRRAHHILNSCPAPGGRCARCGASFRSPPPTYKRSTFSIAFSACVHHRSTGCVAVDLHQSPLGVVILHQRQRLALVGLQTFGNNFLACHPCARPARIHRHHRCFDFRGGWK